MHNCIVLQTNMGIPSPIVNKKNPIFVKSSDILSVWG